MSQAEESKPDQIMEETRGRRIPLKAIVDTAMDGIISMSEQQEIILFNSAAEHIFGWSADQVLGKSIEILIPSRFRSVHHEHIQQFGKSNVETRRMGLQRTVSALRSTGEEFPIEASISKSLDGDSLIYTVILRDVTESLRYRQQVEEQSQMLDQVSDAVSVTDMSGCITYWNEAAVRLFGWGSQEAVGKKHRQLLYRGDPEIFRRMEHETNERGSWVGELTKANRNGVQIIVEHRRTLLRDASGAPKGYLCIDIDITERKKREQAARRSQRLESIGTLAGGIAHDLNNMLTPISMGAQLLMSKSSSIDREGILRTMVASAQRGSDLVKQVLAFSGGLRGERVSIDLAAIIVETRHLLEHTLPKSIGIEVTLAADCPFVLGDATEISQILMNLCINARDAMPNGGTLTVETQIAVIDEPSLQLNPDAAPGTYAVLRVTDTGCGMTPDILDRVFEPFFTTKEVGKGTGLGLATVLGIVKSYGGFINLYSEPGSGTTFTIYLPAVDSTEQSQVVSDDSREQVAQGQTVLLVDDEAFIQQVASAVLEANGYQVMTALDGSAAIKIFEEHRDGISVVLLDMMMPGLDGLETLDALRTIDPEVIVIACSGLRTTQREIEVQQRGAKAFLPKPYSEEQLLQAIRQVSTPARPE